MPRNPSVPWIVWLLVFVMDPGLAAGGPLPSALDAAASPDASPAPAAGLSQLIDQLGSEEFARRERAQAELQRLGLAAFDALHEAQSSDDIEIALRSRYLLRSMNIQWAREDDPLQVKNVLRGYGDKSVGERTTLMEQLAKLPDGLGITALCRLVRFDDANLLSKRAALLLLRYALSDGGGEAMGAAILQEIGPSQRQAAEWLRTYVGLQDDPAALLQAWEAIAGREEKTLRLAPETTSPEIVRDLLRWQADLLERLGREAESLQIVMRTLDLLDGTREQLLETVDWLMQREAWSTVEDVAKRFAERFDESGLLLYRLAEAQSKQGREAEAEQTAQRALAAIGENLQDHIIAAFTLQQRGLFAWSEGEYRHVTAAGPPGSQFDLRARFLLSEMLHENARDFEAAEVLKPAVQAMDSDPNVEYLVRRIGREPESIRSRMRYFYAEHALSQGNSDQQKEHLREAIQQDPTDADVLIAMYRLADADDAWKQTTRQRLQQAAQQNREQIRAAEQSAAAAPNEEIRAIYQRQLAIASNQLAWLISNTEGDFDEALRCSQRSLELQPETAGYLDTLGRCYYAKGDYQQAVAVQARAAELEPHSGLIQRQLKFFQQALQASGGSQPP